MRESRALEFKSDITSTFLKTVSAFANYGQGKILFGVSDNGENLGVKNPDEVCLNIENKINDSISPKPNYSLSVNRRTKVITLEVEEGKFKPYLYKGKAYKRNGTATVEVDQIELKRLTLEGSNLYFESLPCKEKKLTFNYLEQILQEKLGVTKITEDTVKTLGLMLEKDQYTNAAALISDENSFPGIDIARFGNSISEILDRETIAGVSILEQFEQAVKVYKRYYQYEQIAGITRETVELIPEAAFREAVANAIVHRTWDVNANIRISMFADHIDVSSPGGLPNGMTVEEYLNGSISSLRNPVIGNLFFRLHYIEMFGTGIRRIRETYKEYKTKPTFTVTDNSITVFLPVKKSNFSVTVDEQAVLDLFDNGMRYSSSEIAERLSWSRDKVIRVLKVLVDGKHIQKIGKGRGTKYSKM